MTDAIREAPLKICSEEDCDRPVKIYAHGLCRRCYGRRSGDGTLTPILCPVPDCVNNHYRRGPCRIHRDEFTASGMHWCTYPGCSQPLKDVSEFFKNGRRGLHPWCKPCDLERRKQGGYTDNPGRYHGLTADQYWAMLAAQDWRCAICQKDLDRNSRKSKYPNIDHDHVHCPGSRGCPECVRSILCNGCNILLGRAQDNPAILHRWEPTKKTPQQWLDSAIAYLEYWHAEMVKRGVRPSPDEALWQDVFGAIGRLVMSWPSHPLSDHRAVQI